MSLVTLLSENELQIAENAVSMIEQRNIGKYASLARDQLMEQTRKTVGMFVYSIESGKDSDFSDFMMEVGRERALMGFQFKDVQIAVSMIREAILDCLEKTSDEKEEILRRFRIIMKVVDKARLALGEAFLQTREEIIARQKLALQELSTPVIPVFDYILVVPLIGSIDTARSQDILQNLLQGIVKEQAKIAILDVTGVPVIDTNVGYHLLKTVQAANLLGCTCIVVGIGPVVAQTIVNLGLDFGKLVTRHNLRQGLEYALKLLHLEIRSTRTSDV